MLLIGILACLVANPIATYVIHASTDALDVVAPNKAQAQEWAKMWVDSVDNPLITDKVVDDPAWDGLLNKSPAVRMQDRCLVSEAWKVVSSLPEPMRGKTTTIPYDRWSKIPAKSKLDGSNWEWVLGGYQPAYMVNTVCFDAPGYTVAWQQYRFYYVTIYAYVWYVDAPNSETALATSRDFWLVNGIWKPGRRVDFDEWSQWSLYWRGGFGKPPAPFRVPELPWGKLLASTVVDTKTPPTPGGKIQRCRFRMPDGIDYLSETPFVAESPVDFRIPKDQD